MKTGTGTTAVEDPRKEKFDAAEMPEVLIISGDIGLSHFLGEGLVLHGFWTSTVASGFQALEVFRLRQFDLILLDATIADISPCELIKRLKTPVERGESDGDVRARAPITLIAGDEAEVVAARVPPNMVAGTFLPPLELEELAAVLKRILLAVRAPQ